LVVNFASSARKKKNRRLKQLSSKLETKEKMKKERGRFEKEGERKQRSIRRGNEVMKEGKVWKKSRQVVARINEECEERKCREESEV